MGALWCWQRGGPDARGYGVSAVLSALAFLLLPLSTVFGPIFPALVGLIVLGCFKSDLYYLLAAAASFAALFFGNINTRLYLGTPRRYIEAGAEPSLTFITLGLLMVTLGLIAVAVHSRESLVGDIGTARP
ncbi:hypothetical protein ACHABX_13630 [Nesterenkonia halotolerans]|uniref:hypothetical protein n=1 Tax=Nesterenkonia halotolerans TaxID=225325 RepID=UPI003EE74DD4